MTRLRIRCRVPEHSSDPRFFVVPSIIDTDVYAIADDGSETPLTNVASITFRVGGNEAATAVVTFDNVEIDAEALCTIDQIDALKAWLEKNTERLRSAFEKDRGAVAGTYCDGGVSTDFGDVCADLADVVLANVRTR